MPRNSLKSSWGELPFLTEDLEHPVFLLDLVGIAEDIPAAVVANHVVFVEHGAMGVYRREQQDKRQYRQKHPLRKWAENRGEIFHYADP